MTPEEDEDDRAAPPKGGRTESRRAARIAAVQALYEQDMTGATTDTVLRDFLEDRWKKEDESKGTPPAPVAGFNRGLFTELVRGVAGGLERLDEILNAVMGPEHRVERLEMVLRAIMRAGCFELSTHENVPAKVVISEYVAIADGFFTGKQPGLVNGVLDRVAWTLRTAELEAAKGEPTGED